MRRQQFWTQKTGPVARLGTPGSFLWWSLTWVKSFQKGTEKFLPTILPSEGKPRAFPAMEPKNEIRQDRVKSDCWRRTVSQLHHILFPNKKYSLFIFFRSIVYLYFS